MAKQIHPYLDDFLRDLSARTGFTHIYGRQAFAQRLAPGKIVIWAPPSIGSAWLEAETSPAVHVPAGDVFCGVRETCLMHIWGEDEYDAMAILFKTWRDGFDKAFVEADAHIWRAAIGYGTVSLDGDFVPETGCAITDRITVQYLLPRQGEIFGVAESASVAGSMVDNAGDSIGAI